MTREQEKEANEFALELLIPTHMITKDIDELRKQGYVDIEVAIRNLAKKYQVDILPMTIQLLKLELINV